MAEMLVVLFPVPGLVVPGRRRIAAVGEAQLLADRPVDIADIGAGKRDTKLHIGRAEEQLLPRCFGFLEGGPEILLVRLEESRVGNGCVSTCRSRGSPVYEKKKQKSN